MRWPDPSSVQRRCWALPSGRLLDSAEKSPRCKGGARPAALADDLRGWPTSARPCPDRPGRGRRILPVWSLRLHDGGAGGRASHPDSSWPAVGCACCWPWVMSVGLMAPLWQPGWPPRDWAVDGLPGRAGQRIISWVADGVAIVLIKVQSRGDEQMFGSALDPYLPLLILTHFHADHVDGLAGVLERRSIGQIWVSPLAAPAQEVAIVHDLGQETGDPAVVTPPVGMRVRSSGSGPARVLGPVTYSVGRGVFVVGQKDDSMVVLVDRVRRTDPADRRSSSPPGRPPSWRGGRICAPTCSRCRITGRPGRTRPSSPRPDPGWRS